MESLEPDPDIREIFGLMAEAELLWAEAELLESQADCIPHLCLVNAPQKLLT